MDAFTAFYIASSSGAPVEEQSATAEQGENASHGVPVEWDNNQNGSGGCVIA